MRLIQRLAAGMCEQRAVTLRASSRDIGQAARQRAWGELPKYTQHLLRRALALHDRLEAVKSMVERQGFALDYNLKGVRSQDAVTYKDAHDRQRKAEAAVQKRIEGIALLKQRALRDTLGMTELEGKAYLAQLETRLEKV